MRFRGRDFLTLLDYTTEEINTILDVAADLKNKRRIGIPHEYLKGKTIFLLFYNQSLRTRNSFEAGIFQLGGHANFLDPGKIYTPALKGDEVAYSTERISDVARTLASYGEAIAIRIYGDPTGWQYGKGHQMLKEFAEWSNIPLINMECDKYHPCQALADMLTVKEKVGGFNGKKFVMSWAYSPSTHKPLSVPQSAVIGAAKMGMDIVVAHPEGFELDDKVINKTKEIAIQNGGSFSISYDMKEAFKDADVVYPKSWGSKKFVLPFASKVDHDAMKVEFDKNKDWICNSEKMNLIKPTGIYMHCLPCDRGYEVTDEVIDGPQSAAFDEAENRLHVQKAVMSLIM